MPPPARAADHIEFQELVRKAEQARFSRTAKGLVTTGAEDYIVMPYLLESSPALAWICTVVSVSPALFFDVEESPRLSFARLDISLRDFKNLQRLSRKESEQLVHLMSWQAFQWKSRDARE